MFRFLRDAKLYDLLLRIDEDLAEPVRAQGCPQCGSALHRGDFPRKPRGIPQGVGPFFSRRISFCCRREGCRARRTPRSVRFLGRKVYLGALVVLLSAFRGGFSARRVERLHRFFGVTRRTLERWRQWWREVFPQGAFWKVAQGRFPAVVNSGQLPRSLWGQFSRTDCLDRLLDLLRFLAPITSESIPLFEASR
jgi:hypothetical protein